MTDTNHKPLLIVVSAPSGAGKTTLCERLLCEHTDIIYSVSCTTRSPRGQEEEGMHYFFMADEAFRQHVDAGAFLEHADVHGCRYGTLKSTVFETLDAGNSILMDLDIQGAAQIRKVAQGLPQGSAMKEGFVDIFIEPPSLDALRDRLVRRGEDSEDSIQCRIRNAELEMRHRNAYRHRIINRDVDEAYDEFQAIIVNELTNGLDAAALT